MDKYEVAQILREIGIILELTDPNPKKGLAYRRAAFVVESIQDLNIAVEQESLETYSGIGKTISEMISNLVKKGSLTYYQTLKERIPESLIILAQVPGLGLNRLRFLYENYHVNTIEDLENLLKNPSFIKVKNFGPLYIQRLIKKIDQFKIQGASLLYPQAYNLAQIFIGALHKYINRIELAGDLRRKMELIYVIDLIAVTNQPDKCLSIIRQHGLIQTVIKEYFNKISALTKQGVKINLFLTTEHQFVFDLINLTGNEKHIMELKDRALELGFPSFATLFNTKIKSEQDAYQKLGIPYIYPEMREGFGEIQAGIQGKLPNLIEQGDLKGTFHCHTVDSDGRNTMEELIEAAKNLGWEYIGIADHSKSSYQARGMNEEEVIAQIEKITKINAKIGPSFKLFAGIECDILKNGELDFSNDILKLLDYVIISIHRYFNLEEKVMTKRLIKAIENPYTTMVGHLTGRILRYRDPYEINIPKIIDAAVANGKIIELNAYPNRLDMDWRWWIKGKEKGLKCAINPDAHSLKDLLNCQFGINMARKGWLEKKDVLNTLSLSEITETRYLL